MRDPLSRRRFLARSVVVGGAAAGWRYEEQNLLAAQNQPTTAPVPLPAAKAPFPSGKIAGRVVSRLICGGNLISGFAHSRDLIYVSSLLKQYFTDDKVLDTLALCEAQGLNTCILRMDADTTRILSRYWKERGGKLQWIAQIRAREDDLTSDAQKAIDQGAIGVYLHGGVGDDFVAGGKADLLGKFLDYGKSRKVITGVAGHSIEVPKACVRAGFEPDFFMKTFNSKRYWSAGPLPRNDSVWEETPQETQEFMAEVDRPWIAYKVLGAGAIHPREGFTYAYQGGADFLCVGMFDFQVAEDVTLARAALEKAQERDRPWCG